MTNTATATQQIVSASDLVSGDILPGGRVAFLVIVGAESTKVTFRMARAEVFANSAKVSVYR